MLHTGICPICCIVSYATWAVCGAFAGICCHVLQMKHMLHMLAYVAFVAYAACAACAACAAYAGMFLRMLAYGIVSMCCVRYRRHVYGRCCICWPVLQLLHMHHMLQGCTCCICWRMLTYSGMFLHMLAKHILQTPHILSHRAYASICHTCWYMLHMLHMLHMPHKLYMCICWYMLVYAAKAA